MNLYDRIRQLRENLGMTQEQLAQKTGYKSRSAINKIEKGLRDINQSQIKAFADALETTPAYLMGWENNKENDLTLKHPELIKIKNLRKVPVLSEIACGNPINGDIDDIEYIEIPDTIKGDYAYKARGDSMINVNIDDEDTVFIRQQPTANNGDIVAVNIKGDITLKTFRDFKDKLYFMPENREYEPIIIDKSELEYTNVEILGIATHILKKIKRLKK